MRKVTLEMVSALEDARNAVITGDLVALTCAFRTLDNNDVFDMIDYASGYEPYGYYRYMIADIPPDNSVAPE